MGSKKKVLHRVVPVLLLSVALSAAAQATGPAAASLEAAIREGMTAYVRGEYRDAARILEAALGPKRIAPPGNAAQEQLALGNLANLYWLQGRYADAEAVARRAAEAAQKASGADQVDHALDHARELSRLGAVLRAQGRYREAESVFLDVLRRLEPYGVDHAYVATCLTSLAELSRLQGRLEEAERRYWRAYMIRSYLYGADSSPVGETLSGLAEVLAGQGRGAEARPLLARALAIAQKPPRSQGWDRLDERDLREMNRPERETVATRGLISVREAGPRHLEHAEHFDNLGRLYRAHERYADAEAMQRRAIGIRERAFGAEHPQVLQSLAEIALIRKQRGDSQGALEHLRAASAVAGRRIAAWPMERAEYAEGERRRWRPMYLLMLSILPAAPGAAAFDEAFAALQYANVAAAVEAPLSAGEVRSLLGKDEALLTAASHEGVHYFAVVRRESLQLQRVEQGAALSQALRRALAGVNRTFVVSDASLELPHGAGMRLLSAGALRDLKRPQASQ